MNSNGHQNNFKSSPGQYHQPQYPQSPQYPQYPPNPGYYGGAPQGYPPQQNYNQPNQPYYKPVKKKSKIKRAIFLLIFLAALSAAVWHYARPIQQRAVKLYWQNQWRFVKGKTENEKEIKKTLDSFISALEKKDINAAAVFIYPDKAGAYKKMFTAKPDGMKALAASLSSIEGIKMTDVITQDNVGGRIAEVKIIYNKTEYEIQLKKVNDKWYVFNI